MKRPIGRWKGVARTRGFREVEVETWPGEIVITDIECMCFDPLWKHDVKRLT
jgi:hypothetical protein